MQNVHNTFKTRKQSIISAFSICMTVPLKHWKQRVKINNICFFQNYAFECIARFSTTISFIICWYFLMFYQIILSPQVKRWAFITYKHGVYELPHELPNDLRNLRKLGNIRKLSKLHRMIAQYPVPLPKWKFC